MKFKLQLLFCLFVFYGSRLTANEVTPEISDYEVLYDSSVCKLDCIETGKWHLGVAIGLGHITTPIAEEDDTRLPVIPQFSYYGEKFFVDNFTIGYSFVQGKNYSLDFIGDFNRDFIHFHTASSVQKAFVLSGGFGDPESPKIPVHIGDYDLKKRYATYLVGPSFRYQGEGWSLKTSYKKDVTGLNYGTEFNFELGQHFTYGKWSFQHAIGVVWKSQEIVNYYYGIEPEESPFPELAYSAQGAAKVPYYEFNTQYQFNHQWRFLISIKSEKLNKSITESPIVNKDEVNSVFVGFGYDFF